MSKHSFVFIAKLIQYLSLALTLPLFQKTLLMLPVLLAPSLPAEWGPVFGEKGMERRREALLFPHNNRGIHGHPAPHQSTGWED